MNKLSQKQKGQISIFLVILVLSVVFTIIFGMSGIMVYQIRMSGWEGESVQAYQAADAGIEYFLNQIKNSGSIGAAYLCSGCALGQNCPTVGEGSYCLETDDPTLTNATYIKAKGKFKDTQRAIKIVRD